MEVGALTLVGGVALGGVAVGLAIGREWILLLAFLIPVAFIPAGEDSHGSAEWAWALILLTPPALVGLAVGVAIRKGLRRRSRSA